MSALSNGQIIMHTDSWLWHCALALAFAAYGGSVAGVAPDVTAQEGEPLSAAMPPTDPSKAGPTARHRVKKTQAPAQPKLNGLAQTAANAGIVDCVGRIQQTTEFLTANSKSGAFLFIAPADANRHIASASLEIQANGASSYASASFAPGGNNGCGTLYETVSYWGNRCEEVAKRAYPNFPPAGKLGESITMLEGGLYLRIFLMPAGQGCLSIKKELVY
jgi:hypothetical protein